MWLRFTGSGIFPSIWFASGLCCARWPATQLHFSRTPNAAPRDGWPPGMARGSLVPSVKYVLVPNRRPPSREGHLFTGNTEALIDADLVARIGSQAARIGRY